MPNFNEYSPDKRIKALHIGTSGSGKSPAAATYPGPYHQFDMDGRFDGIWASCTENGGFISSKDITFDRFYTRKGYEPVQKKFIELEGYAQAGRFPYGTIELASATTLVQCLINSSHEAQSGKTVAGLRMSGPSDFNFEVTGLKQVIDFFFSLPCNMILSAHIIDKWGKIKGPPGSEYAANQVIGNKICLRDQTGEALVSFFGNVFLFSREEMGGEMHYFVEFNSDLAKNIYGIPPGKHDVTRKPFYPYLQELIKSIREGTFERPKQVTNLGMFG